MNTAEKQQREKDLNLVRVKKFREKKGIEAVRKYTNEQVQKYRKEHNTTADKEEKAEYMRKYRAQKKLEGENTTKKTIVNDILNDIIYNAVDIATSKKPSTKLVKNEQKAEYMKHYRLKKKLEAKSK